MAKTFRYKKNIKKGGSLKRPTTLSELELPSHKSKRRSFRQRLTHKLRNKPHITKLLKKLRVLPKHPIIDSRSPPQTRRYPRLQTRSHSRPHSHSRSRPHSHSRSHSHSHSRSHSHSHSK